MNFEQYSDLRGTNWSLLRELAKSPAHYQYRLHNRREDTPAMRLGRAVHTATLEQDEFPLQWTVYDGRRAGNAWTDFAEVNADKGILTVEEYEKALAIRDAVHRHRAARRLLRWGKPEVSLRWVDPATRIICKGRLDWVAPGGTLIDLKTTRTVEARSFGRLCEQYDYHGQMAYYRRGLVASGRRFGAAYLIAVEAEAPHDVAVYELDFDVLEAGDQLVGRLLHQLKECRRKRRWPGAYPDVQSLEFPSWALPATSDFSDRIEVLS